jgi:hypothetical protein
MHELRTGQRQALMGRSLIAMCQLLCEARAVCQAIPHPAGGHACGHCQATGRAKPPGGARLRRPEPDETPLSTDEVMLGQAVGLIDEAQP